MAKKPRLADGPGREVVQTVCGSCHVPGLVTRSSGYSAEHWRTLTGTMVDLSASPKQSDEIVDYLAAHFPPNDRRAAKTVAGDAAI